MTIRSTRPDAEGSSREARPDLEQKLDQMLATLAETNRKAEMAHEAILGLKNKVAEVRRDNIHLEGMLASQARSQWRQDFDKEVQQESGGQPQKTPRKPGRCASRLEARNDGRIEQEAQGPSQPDPDDLAKQTV
ncbi:hypothetical protein PanWU01x14_225040 [Parasponia andersonii]|uniref:Uncharacterized protein n=1 Tax=Parasponia andersonii TaxID=3476 RepID=A0A2P5BN18_PARAD|nr:hypothetical protein PanWU01x14_225040 [Parasponia andersonii]